MPTGSVWSAFPATNPRKPSARPDGYFHARREAAMTLFLRTHAPDRCSGEFCVIHNPSDHPLRDAPLHWRADKGVMERICVHGIGHDDPDDVAHRKRMGVKHAGVHGCDGCCWKERDPMTRTTYAPIEEDTA